MDGYSEVYQLIFEITVYSNCNICGWEMYMYENKLLLPRKILQNRSRNKQTNKKDSNS